MTSPSLAVTTAVNPSSELEARAQHLALELNAPYAPRRNVTLARVFAATNAARLLVAETERLRLRDQATGIEYAYHPNLAVVRGANLRRGARDLFADATLLKSGERLLDCTVGFAAEAILGSWLVGDTGLVVGLESVPELAAVTREGLQTFPLPMKEFCAAMRRVGIVTSDYRDYLPRCASRAFEVVYFDPFFGERLSGSEESVSPLALFGSLAPLDAPSVLEARRVARRSVIIKHPPWEALPAPVEAEVSHQVTARHSRLVYSVLNAF